ncbi:hypothetical protein FISHEDRAFT_60546 [Fistulina hepatica ATCC 64428]|uniref:F-box domain-containing protein n=1 Tax=Fistulina hepatica ATCC 64428 TaxID=1128425 RepID=A0A0D7A5Q7_9AGAR|nr:hypothetical protein FISHEDRAFT_60546 [Fistulina hepatica ATCC 64428]
MLGGCDTRPKLKVVIQDFPAELLAVIFTHAYPFREFRQFYRACDAELPFVPSFSIPYVCKLWHDVCFAARLHCGVDFCIAPSEVVNAYCAATHPYTIHLRVSASLEDSCPDKPLILRNCARIETISFVLDDENDFTGFEDLHMPALQTMDLSRDPQLIFGDPEVPERLFLSTPQLTSLGIDLKRFPTGTRLPWSQLRTLCIRSTVDGINDWLNCVASSCHALDTLMLVQFVEYIQIGLDPFGVEEAENIHSTRILLPHLRVLFIDHSSSATADILARIDAPSLSTIALNAGRPVVTAIRTFVERSACNIQTGILFCDHKDSDPDVARDFVDATAVKALEILCGKRGNYVAFAEMLGDLVSCGDHSKELQALSFLSKDTVACRRVIERISCQSTSDQDQDPTSTSICPSLRELRLGVSRDGPPFREI